MNQRMVPLPTPHKTAFNPMVMPMPTLSTVPRISFNDIAQEIPEALLHEFHTHPPVELQVMDTFFNAYDSQMNAAYDHSYDFPAGFEDGIP